MYWLPTDHCITVGYLEKWDYYHHNKQEQNKIPLGSMVLASLL